MKVRMEMPECEAQKTALDVLPSVRNSLLFSSFYRQGSTYYWYFVHGKQHHLKERKSYSQIEKMGGRFIFSRARRQRLFLEERIFWNTHSSRAKQLLHCID